MMRKDIFHEFCEREHAEHDSNRQPEQEGAVDGFPEFCKTALKQHLPGGDAHQGVERFYEFIEYSGEQGDGAS